MGPVKRVVLKVSGESLAGENGYGISPDSLNSIVASVIEAVEVEAELAIVVGGGNIFRGSQVADALGIESATADYMSILGTVINALALQAALERREIPTRVQSAIEMQEIAEPYIRRRAIPAPGERTGGDLRRRDRQPVLHDGHGRGVAGA